MSFFLQKVITSATSSRVIIRKMFSAKVTLKFQDSMTGVTGGLQFYDSKSRYALEQESSEAKGEFLQLYEGGSSVPMPSFAATSGRKAKGRKEASASQMLSIELRTPNGTMMRIQGEMGQDFIQSIIRASSGHV